ncbi:MAG TPA: ClpX C4-type zinc finger protein [Gemmataceae bacterium]
MGLFSRTQPARKPGVPRNVYCSFCRKSHMEVGPFVEGPGDVYICRRCTDLCLNIFETEKQRRDAEAAS